MSVAPQLQAVLSKIEADVLADLSALLIPGLIAEIEALSPASAQSTEALVFTAIQPAAQAAWASLVAKVVPQA
jgi:hypothetical protein